MVDQTSLQADEIIRWEYARHRAKLEFYARRLKVENMSLGLRRQIQQRRDTLLAQMRTRIETRIAGFHMSQTDFSLADEIGREFKHEAIQRVDGRLGGTPSEELLRWLAANIVPEKSATPLFEDTFSEKEKREFQEMKRALVADLNGSKGEGDGSSQGIPETIKQALSLGAV
ncbi:hypothetical protein B0H13DRAFT_1889882 [Mycena leptocephala]|nr:hypothetical protein B0H13DRAFT_1889882 [Mycena leptocephala]